MWCLGAKVPGAEVPGAEVPGAGCQGAEHFYEIKHLHTFLAFSASCLVIVLGPSRVPQETTFKLKIE